MKKLSSLFLLLCIGISSFAQSYQPELNKLNDYLKTFDDGYYGYFEVKDGYLYDRFKSGKYTKVLISKLSYATESTESNKIIIPCKDNADCVFSTYTDSYHKQLSLSQSKSFNRQELINLFNNFFDKYNNKTTTTPRIVPNRTNTNTSSSTQNTTTNTVGYTDALSKLNNYLKTFDNGYYGYFEVKDGYIYIRFKANKFNKFRMEDMEGAIIQEQYSRVIFKCKSGACIETDWKVNGREEYTQFTTSGSYNYQELATLLNNFRDAYLGKKNQNSMSNTEEDYTNSSEFLDGLNSNIDITKSNTQPNNSNTSSRDDVAKKLSEMAKSKNNNIDKEESDWEDEDFDALAKIMTNDESKSQTTSQQNYSKALQELNAYLSTFNKDVYRSIAVKNGDVYFYYNVFDTDYFSRISISSLKNNTILVALPNENKVKIMCKNENKCFWSTYSDEYKDHFQFFPKNNSAGIDTIKTLLDNFLKKL